MPADRPLRSIRPRPPSKPYPVATPSKPTRSPSPLPNLAAVEDVKPAHTSPTPSPSSTPTPKDKAKPKAKGKKGATKATVKNEVGDEPVVKGGYDRALLVALVAKVCPLARSASVKTADGRLLTLTSRRWVGTLTSLLRVSQLTMTQTPAD